MYKNIAYAAATGNYQLRGNPEDADCVIAQSFGTLDTQVSVNGQLAELATTFDRPMILQQEIAAALPDDAEQPALIVSGDPSGADGGGLTSWGVLERAKQFMEAEGLYRPLLVAQAYHIGRVALQTKRVLGTYPIVPSGMPKTFDADSEQPWTQERGLWVKRELPGLVMLKMMHQL